MTLTLRKISWFGVAMCMAATMLLPSYASAAFAENELFQNEKAADIGIALGVNGDKSVTVLVVSLIRSFLGLLGIVAVVIIVVGGFQWMTAGGKEDGVKEAKTRIMQGVIGMAIVLAAFAAAQFVIKALMTAVA